MKRLENKDISLVHSMIPLVSQKSEYHRLHWDLFIWKHHSNTNSSFEFRAHAQWSWTVPQSSWWVGIALLF